MEEELSNEELFNSALNDLPDAPEPEAVAEPEGDTRARDEQGRFVEKQAEPEKPKPETTETQAKPAEAKEEAVPSWRLREIREERDALRARLAQFERQSQPRPEATPKPDIFENPDGFIKSNLQEALTPVQQEIATIKEFYSRESAIARHGEARVTEAFTALDQAAKAGDPQALAVVQHVKASMNPFGEIVNWYAGAEASRNPEAFFERKLQERLQDEKFKGELMQRLQPVQESAPKPVFKVPPSLNRAASAAASLDEAGDLSNESLFSNALR